MNTKFYLIGRGGHWWVVDNADFLAIDFKIIEIGPSEYEFLKQFVINDFNCLV